MMEESNLLIWGLAGVGIGLVILTTLIVGIRSIILVRYRKKERDELLKRERFYDVKGLREYARLHYNLLLAQQSLPTIVHTDGVHHPTLPLTSDRCLQSNCTHGNVARCTCGPGTFV